MALVLDFSTSEFPDATGLSFYDKTGIWGTPNADIATVSTATVDITLSDGTVCNQVNVYVPGVFPNTANAPFLITNLLLGIPAGIVLPDGKTDITYTVTAGATDPGTEYSVTKSVYLLANICCCKQTLNLKATLDDCCTDCKEFNDLVDDFNFAFDILTANITAGNWSQADEILEDLQLMCREANCVNCP